MIENLKGKVYEPCLFQFCRLILSFHVMNRVAILRMRTSSRVGCMLESCISRFSTLLLYLFDSDILKFRSKRQVSELEPHVRLLGPAPELLPFYLINGIRHTQVSETKEPWKNDGFSPLPNKSSGNPCLDLFLFVGPDS
jgi:hypothetical protein